jgi:hypothetical protein
MSFWAYFITFGVVCFNATLINHATEIRTYAFLPTIALAIFYLFQRIADADFKLSRGKSGAAIILFCLAIWFHVYGILMFICCFLFALLSKYKENDFRFSLRNAAFFLVKVLCFAMPFWLYSVFREQLSTQLANPFEYIPNPLNNILGCLKGVFGNLVGFKMAYFLLAGLAVPFVFSYEARFKQLLFLFLVIFLPLGFIFLVDVTCKYWFIQRQFVWLMPLFAFFLGWAWESLILLFKHFINRDYAA